MPDSLPTLWTAACQTPLPVGSSRQEYWSGVPRPFLGDLSDSGIEPASLVSPALAGGFFTASAMREAPAVVKGAALLHSAVDGHLGCLQTFFVLKPVLNQDGGETRFSFMLENKQRMQRRSHQ